MGAEAIRSGFGLSLCWMALSYDFFWYQDAQT